MARPDDTLTVLLTALRAQDERTDRFQSEIRASLKSARAESHSFRDEMDTKISKIETDIAVNTAITEALQKQRTSWGAVVAWVVGTLIAAVTLWGQLR